MRSSSVSETSARQRLVGSTVFAALSWLIFSRLSQPLVAALGAWCVFAICNLVLTYWCVHWRNAEQTRLAVQQQDQSSFLIMLIVVASALASIAGIVLLLMTSKNVNLQGRIGHVALGFLCIACSWLLIHMRYGLHYAHLYYSARFEAVPCLKLPEEKPPRYSDFMYFSFVLGMTSQVSDITVVHHRIRKLVLVHSLLAFVFNLVIVAFFINILGSAI